MENKTVEMVVKDLLLADNRKKKKKKIPFPAGDAGVRTVGTDVLFECPRCLGRRDNGTYDWSVPLCKLKKDPPQ